MSPSYAHSFSPGGEPDKVPANDNKVSLNQFCKDCFETNQHWWHDQATGERLDRNLDELLMLVVSEVAEAMEGERKDLMDTHLTHRKMVEVELADVAIRLGDIAGSRGLDIEAATDCTVGYVMAGTPENKPAALFEIVKSLCLHKEELDVRIASAFLLTEAYALKHDLDLWGAVAEKRAYNATRADHKREARLAANGKKF